MSREDVEVIKVEISKPLAEKFRRYVAEKYGLKRGSLSRAMTDLIEKELRLSQHLSNTIDDILGLGILSDYKWEGEDLTEALRRKINVPNRR